MRCFACDCFLSDPKLDRPTGRYYCYACMEFTNNVILSMEKSDSEYEIIETYVSHMENPDNVNKQKTKELWENLLDM